MTTTILQGSSSSMATTAEQHKPTTQDSKPQSHLCAENNDHLDNTLTEAESPPVSSPAALDLSVLEDQHPLPSESPQTEYFVKAYKKMVEEGKRPAFPKGAFCYFSSIRRTQIRADQPGLPQPKIFKTIKREWRKMTQDDKEGFKIQAKRDYEDYRRLLDIWEAKIKPEAPPAFGRAGPHRESKAWPTTSSESSQADQLLQRRCPNQNERYTQTSGGQKNQRPNPPFELHDQPSESSPPKFSPATEAQLRDSHPQNDSRVAERAGANLSSSQINIKFPQAAGLPSSQKKLSNESNPTENELTASKKESEPQAQAPTSKSLCIPGPSGHVLNFDKEVVPGAPTSLGIAPSSLNILAESQKYRVRFISRKPAVPFLEQVSRGALTASLPFSRVLPAPLSSAFCWPPAPSKKPIFPRQNKFQLASRWEEAEPKVFQSAALLKEADYTASSQDTGASLAEFIRLGKRSPCNTTDFRPLPTSGLLKRARFE